MNQETSSHELDSNLDSYNWDDGFDFPYKVINHPNCELATALNAFYLAEGMLYLEHGCSECNLSNKAWRDFVEYLYVKIKNSHYSNKLIGFTVPLSKVQKHKLNKAIPDIPTVFLEDISGS